MLSNRGALRSTGRRVADEQLRRVAGRATELIALRYGDRLGMWVGCGYPKSGTVWLCNLLGSYLNLPHAREYRLPIAMPSVVQAHWLPSGRLPPTVYIVRDGRDVMVSWYFREAKLAHSEHNPVSARRRRERFKHILGPGYDLNNAQDNLPRVMQAELTNPSWMTANWPTHVRAWLDWPSETVGIVRYEDLLVDVESALGPVLERLTGRPVDLTYLGLAAQRFDFKRQLELQDSSHVAAPFLRKGVSGDWRQHFNGEAATIFDEAAGDLLDRLGYTRSR